MTPALNFFAGADNLFDEDYDQSYTLQRPGHTLYAEVAFGLENHQVAPDDMPARVVDTLDRGALRRPLALETDHLSMGRKNRAVPVIRKLIAYGKIQGGYR